MPEIAASQMQVPVPDGAPDGPDGEARPLPGEGFTADRGEDLS